MWNSTSFHMRLFDVGQSAAIGAECEALAHIADILGGREHAIVAERMRERWSLLGERINQNLWDDELGVCVPVVALELRSIFLCLLGSHVATFVHALSGFCDILVCVCVCVWCKGMQTLL